MAAMYELDGKVAVVTGASRGVGAALARRLVQAGVRVALVARSGEPLHALAEQLRQEAPGGALPCTADIRDPGQARMVIERAVNMLGGLDLVINNAGALGQLAPLAEVKTDVWADVIQTNLNGAFFVSRNALDVMRGAGGGGRIVFVSSSVGRAVRPQWGAYAVSKYACEGLMQLLAMEEAEHGIAAFSVNPGGTATRMRRSAFPDEDPSTLPSTDRVAQAFLTILQLDDTEVNGRAFDVRNYL